MLVLAGCGGPQPGDGSVGVGAGPDPDSVLLANLYAAALRYYGTPAHVVELSDPLAGLDSGEVTVVPGYTGRLLQRFAPGTRGTGDEQVYKAMVGMLPEGVSAGDYATAAEDKPAVAITEATAADWDGRDLATMVEHCDELRPGAPRGMRPPSSVGTCTLPAPREFSDDTALFEALQADRINVAWTMTADPKVPGEVVVLADRKPNMVRAQNVVPLYRRNELSARQVLAVNEVAGVLDTATLKQLRKDLAAGADPRVLAEEWLAENPLGR
ncbi:glycine betaine ABC transporter substrate-binding protein [[Mycobacterium] burgundiense]|uniref:Glycine betaine ABC transporter substrate-binding protein n=1 Tax=[Mycobacterium] burgundiense TaxID=3064286 RepID=A0ABM9LG89_9MYCO|nr:glycine betaine ABC transporter substrate-binding protein [Mycolicibacterium sp. MU0053]CAJ1498509.1 glycine betaine ABC transporter substrate-binding protein [Mycolicibacterium sp. MU0053]